MTILWHNGIYSVVKDSTSPGLNCGARVAACFQRIQYSQDVHLRGATLQETKGRALFGELFSLNRETYCGVFLPWCLIHGVFSGPRADQGCSLWAQIVS